MSLVEFPADSVVWLKIKSYPWWPCKVVRVDEDGIELESFEDQILYEEQNAGNIKAFACNDARGLIEDGMKKLRTKPGTFFQYRNAIQDAIDFERQKDPGWQPDFDPFGDVSTPPENPPGGQFFESSIFYTGTPECSTPNVSIGSITPTTRSTRSRKNISQDYDSDILTKNGSSGRKRGKRNGEGVTAKQRKRNSETLAQKLDYDLDTSAGHDVLLPPSTSRKGRKSRSKKKELQTAPVEDTPPETAASSPVPPGSGRKRKRREEGEGDHSMPQATDVQQSESQKSPGDHLASSPVPPSSEKKERKRKRREEGEGDHSMPQATDVQQSESQKSPGDHSASSPVPPSSEIKERKRKRREEGEGDHSMPQATDVQQSESQKSPGDHSASSPVPPGSEKKERKRKRREEGEGDHSMPQATDVQQSESQKSPGDHSASSPVPPSSEKKERKRKRREEGEGDHSMPQATDVQQSEGQKSPGDHSASSPVPPSSGKKERKRKRREEGEGDHSMPQATDVQQSESQKSPGDHSASSPVPPSSEKKERKRKRREEGEGDHSMPQATDVQQSEGQKSPGDHSASSPVPPSSGKKERKRKRREEGEGNHSMPQATVVQQSESQKSPGDHSTSSSDGRTGALEEPPTFDANLGTSPKVTEDSTLTSIREEGRLTNETTAGESSLTVCSTPANWKGDNSMMESILGYRSDSDAELSHSSESSEDDLPDFNMEVKESVKVKELKPNEIVWAKFRKFPYWPAIVVKVDVPRKKLPKASVAFFGYKYGTVSIRNKKNIVRFINGTKRTQDFMELGLKQKCGLKEVFQEATEEAQRLSRWRIEKKITGNPEEQLQLIMETRPKNYEVMESPMAVQARRPSPDVQSTGVGKVEESGEESSKESELDSETEEEEEEDSLYNLENILKVFEELEPELIRIIHGKEPSEFHQLFYSGTRKEKEGLKMKSIRAFGPASKWPEKKKLKLVDHLEGVARSVSANKHQFNYALDVLLPEAMARTIGKFEHVPLKEAYGKLES